MELFATIITYAATIVLLAVTIYRIRRGEL